jgi:hypothetical protein
MSDIEQLDQPRTIRLSRRLASLLENEAARARTNVSDLIRSKLEASTSEEKTAAETILAIAAKPLRKVRSSKARQAFAKAYRERHAP